MISGYSFVSQALGSFRVAVWRVFLLAHVPSLPAAR